MILNEGFSTLINSISVLMTIFSDEPDARNTLGYYQLYAYNCNLNKQLANDAITMILICNF